MDVTLEAAMLTVFFAIVGALLALMSVTTVDAGNVGVVRRLGREHRTLPAGGPYFILPIIDTAEQEPLDGRN